MSRASTGDEDDNDSFGCLNSGCFVSVSIRTGGICKNFFVFAAGIGRATSAFGFAVATVFRGRSVRGAGRALLCEQGCNSNSTSNSNSNSNRNSSSNRNGNGNSNSNSSSNPNSNSNSK